MRTYTMIERGGGWEVLRGHYSRWHRSTMPARYVRMCILASTRAAIPAGEDYLVIRIKYPVGRCPFPWVEGDIEKISVARVRR